MLNFVVETASKGNFKNVLLSEIGRFADDNSKSGLMYR